MAEDNMSNILNNFKNIINNTSNLSNNNQDKGSANSNNNYNISPDLINNLKDMLQDKNLTNKKTHESSNSNTNNSDKESSFNIDFETILKIKTLMETLNQNDDPRSNLLYSLKPYLRESRKNKIDQYINLFKLTKVSNLFKKEKGDDT